MCGERLLSTNQALIFDITKHICWRDKKTSKFIAQFTQSSMCDWDLNGQCIFFYNHIAKYVVVVIISGMQLKIA